MARSARPPARLPPGCACASDLRTIGKDWPTNRNALWPSVNRAPCISASIAEQPLRGEPGAVTQRRELAPGHVLGDPAVAGGRVEAAIGPGEHAAGIADGGGHGFEAIGDHLRM